MAEPIGRSARRGAGRRKPREERWAELLDVATQVFYEKGYDGASLQDVADRVGMLKGSLYYYIKSKEDLLFEVINSVHSTGLANVKSLAEQEGTPLERLERVVQGHVEHACRNLVPTAVFLHELEVLPEDRQEKILGTGGSYQAVFRDLIEQAIESGDARSDVDPRMASRFILGAANWVYRWFRPGGGMSVGHVAAQIAEMAVLSIASHEGIAARTNGLT